MLTKREPQHVGKNLFTSIDFIKSSFNVRFYLIVIFFHIHVIKNTNNLNILQDVAYKMFLHRCIFIEINCNW